MIKLANPKVSEMLGDSYQTLLTIPFFHYIHPDDREMVRQRQKQRLAGKKPPSSYSLRIITKKGDVKWIKLSVELINWEVQTAILNLINDIRLIIKKDLPVVHGDDPRLREVVQNLIDNAIKFLNDKPDAKIEIGGDYENEEVCFYVQDNGIGIDPKYQLKIFDLFEQLNPEIEGTGIGLALVKRIVEVHNGRIWVASDGYDKGSTFYFTLPNFKKPYKDDISC